MDRFLIIGCVPVAKKRGNVGSVGKGPHSDRIQHFIRNTDGRVWPSEDWPPELKMDQVYRHVDDLTAVPESKVRVYNYLATGTHPIIRNPLNKKAANSFE